MAHLDSITPGLTVYVKGFSDQEFQVVGPCETKTPFPHFTCRLRCTFLTGDQLWRVPALHISKRPFSKLIGLTACTLATFAGAAKAQTVTPGFLKFCEAASSANVSGISAAPGSELAKRVVANTNVKEQDYVSVWNIAKSSIVPICRGLW
jgi:hypothetical protein